MNSIRRISGMGSFSARPEGPNKLHKKTTAAGLSALSHLEEANEFVEATDSLLNPYEDHSFTHLTEYPFDREINL